MLDIYEKYKRKYKQYKVRTCDIHGGFPSTMQPLSGKVLLFTFNWLCFLKLRAYFH